MPKPNLGIFLYKISSRLEKLIKVVYNAGTPVKLKWKNFLICVKIYNNMVPRLIITIIAISAVLGTSAYVNREKLRQRVYSRSLPEPISHLAAQRKIGFVNGSAEIIEIIPVEAELRLNQTPAKTAENPSDSKNTDTKPVPEPSIPAQINFDVPFFSQAPTGVWDDIHEETCEEAAVLMAYSYVKDKKISGAASIDAELLKIIDWETKNFGFWKDTDAAKTAQILKQMFGLKNVEVRYDITIDDIKEEISKGYPVILPTAGRELGNPYFTPPGPVYHMIVAKGYTKDSIITNDPGTRHGSNYIYKNNVLYDAIHDWNGGDVVKGKKAMIVVKE
ncbi:MAG: C39 family peptidase [Patescibacteria group bacterium]